MAIILDGKAMFLKVMGANPPSSVEQTRCYNGGSLSFLSNYRCSAGSTQLVNNDSLYPKKTLLYSATSPEDAYQHGGQVTVIWTDEDWNPLSGSPMSIVASTTRFYNDNGWPSLISSVNGYYMEMSGSTRTYYTLSNGIVTNIGTYTPQVQEYFLELTETELTVGAGATSVDTLIWSYDKDSNSVEFTIEALDSDIQFIDYSYEWLSDGLAQVTLNFGSHSGAQSVGALRVSQIVGTETADIAITREAGSMEVCAADLQSMWMRDNSLDLSGLIAFKSQAHKGEHSSYDVVKVTFSGYSTFRCYIRSYAESNYDYTVVSVLNASSYPTASDSATAYPNANTKGNQQSGTALSNYTEVVFSGLTPSQTYFFYVVYRKDISQDSGNDEGYLLLPSGATYSNPFVPSHRTSDLSRITPTPVNVGASDTSVVIKVACTTDGVNRYLALGNVGIQNDGIGITALTRSTSGDVSVTLKFAANTGSQRSSTVTITHPDDSSLTLSYNIIQAAGQVVSDEVVDLKDIWSVSDRYQDTYPGYRCYKSNNHDASTVGKIAVTLKGRSSLVMYFRSEAEHYFDGLLVNMDSEPTEERAHYFLNTKSRQNETFAIELRNEGLDTGTHTVYAQFEKDSDGDTPPDEAYIWVPSEIPYTNSY